MGWFRGKDAHPDANINRQVAKSSRSMFLLLPNVPDDYPNLLLV
jgi:hypothetical protein